MRKMKKLIVMVLALVMCMGLVSTTAFAASSGKVTITGVSANDQSFGAYQIFSGTLASGTDTALGSIDWGSSISESDYESILSDLAEITIDGKNPFTNASGSALTKASEVAAVLADEKDNSAIVNAFLDVIQDYLTNATAIATSTVSSTPDSDGNYTYTISDLDYGYYLIKNEDASDLTGKDESASEDMLIVVNDNAQISVKEDKPVVDKTVTDNDSNHSTPNQGASNVSTTYTDAATGEVSDYNFGDHVPYTIYAYLPTDETAFAAYDKYEIKFTDTMSTGLTFDETSYTDDNGNLTFHIYVVDAEENETEVKYPQDGITVTPVTDNLGFTLDITDVKSLVDTENQSITVEAGSYIKVTFTATLTSAATVGENGNTNEVYLEYSNNPDSKGLGKTTTVTVKTYTYELDVEKLDTSNNNAKLPGAGFKLYKTVTETVDGVETQVTYYAKVDTTTNKLTGWTTNIDEATELSTTDSNGNYQTIKIIGLDEGTYYLTETTTPPGYNPLSGNITLKISATYEDSEGTVSIEDLELEVTNPDDSNASGSGTASTGVTSTSVGNTKGSSLPGTGGIGTTVFYVVGIVLVLGAAVILITRRRMANKQ